MFGQKTTKEEYEKISAIVERAEAMKIGVGNRMTRLIDITAAHEYFNLDLDKFISFYDFNFAHDFCGIQRHIDRGEITFGGCFLPRFTSTDMA